MDGADSQAFRTSSSKITTIPTRHDPKSGLRVVRWCDIQQYFENAKGILNGEDAVLFLTNDDLEDFIPRRIAHHPGVVLEVFVAENSQGCSNTIHSPDTTLIARDVSSLRITDVGGVCQALVVHSRGQSPDTSMSVQASSLPHDSCTQHPVGSHQESLGLSANQSISDYSSGLQPRPDSTALEEQLKDLRQQVEQIKQQFEDILQQTRHTREQVDDIPQNIESFEQRIQQKIQQLQEQINMVEEIQDECRPVNRIGDISRRRQDMIGRSSVIHYRVQEFLGSLSEEPQLPRFFIVLPKDSDMENGQEDSSSWLFRLHLLCECDSYAMIKDGEGTCEMHLTNHPGYDLKRPKEFFDKYGSYVLTMMYLIKHGTMTSGFVVPPLAHSKLVSRIEATQEQTGLTKKNINGLVDDTIAYLENMARSIGNDMDTTSHWSLTSADLEELKSYLDVDEGEHFPGGLHRLMTQEQHYSWVCNEHQGESAIQRLKDAVNAIDGTYTEKPNKINIKVASDKVSKQLYDVILEVSKIQHITDRLTLAVDCGRLSSTINNSQKDQEVAVTITRLSELTADDIDFIHQCNITQLTIKHNPQDTDEGRLIGILQKSPNLKELRIGCLGERSLTIIKLVISMREKALQDVGSTALRTLEVTDEGLKRFDHCHDSDGNDHMRTSITFSGEPGTFDMDTSIRMQDKQVVTEENWISKFFRQYGWSISYLRTTWAFTDHLAAMLEEVTQIHGSQLTHLILTPLSLATAGLDAMDRIIKRSQRLKYLWLYFRNLEQISHLETAENLLMRHGERLNRISLHGSLIESWLPRLARAFPTRSSFPKLTQFVLYSSKAREEVPHECVQWLVAMASSQPRLSGPSMTEDSSTALLQQGITTSPTLTRLSLIQLSNVILLHQGWEILVKAIDFSTMETISFADSNFSLGQLDVLLDCVAGTDVKSVLLETIGFEGSDLLVDTDKNALRERIRKVVPRVTIRGM